MAHKQQKAFCKSVRSKYKKYFKSVVVVDVGSLDINGNNRYLFDFRSRYLGIDLYRGINVDIVGNAPEVLAKIKDHLWERHLKRNYVHMMAHDMDVYMHQKAIVEIDTIISTEMLEHDFNWEESLLAMYKQLRSGGLQASDRESWICRTCDRLRTRT